MESLKSKHGISSKIIARSKSVSSNIELITYELEYPKYIHGEVMTHRVFSRNAQSSRAIPVETMINRVQESTWYPVFMKNQKGMSASIPLEGEELERAKVRWDTAKRDAIHSAYRLLELNIHKQVINRLLEPFSTINVIVTSTEWNNFFKLRLAPNAMQEIQLLARSMDRNLGEVLAKELCPGQWHLPYITSEEEIKYSLSERKKISSARCARVSYLNHDKAQDYFADMKLHDGLLADEHMSPFEHQAMALDTSQFFANFRGWKQYRWDLEHGF